MIDINTTKIGDIWYYSDLTKDRQYIGTVISVDKILPLDENAFTVSSDPEVIHDMYITIDWIWIRDTLYPDATTGHMTYSIEDLKARGYHDWIFDTDLITEKERLTIILSTK